MRLDTDKRKPAKCFKSNVTHLNIILSISHLKSAECTIVRRVYAFASLEARNVTWLRCRSAASFEFAITSFVGQKITDEKYECQFNFVDTSQT